VPAAGAVAGPVAGATVDGAVATGAVATGAVVVPYGVHTSVAVPPAYW
jgi:hypothetical protein